MRFFEDFSLSVVHDVVNQCVNILLRTGGLVEFLEIAVNTNQGRFARAQMAVRGTLFHAKGQKLSDIHKAVGSYFYES